MTTAIPRPDSPEFLLWRHKKSRVYETPVTSDMDLIARMAEAAARVRDTLAQFELVRESIHRLCEMCIVVNLKNFKYLLCYNYVL